MLNFLLKVNQVIKLLFFKISNLFVFFLVRIFGNLILRIFDILFTILFFVLESIRWFFSNIFFLLKQLGIFIVRIFYVLTYFITKSFVYPLKWFVQKNAYYVILFFNYITLRLQQIKLLVVKLSSNKTQITKYYVSAFTRVKRWLFKSKTFSKILQFFVSVFSFFLIFLYEFFSILFLMSYSFFSKVVFLLKNMFIFFNKVFSYSLNLLLKLMFVFYRKGIKSSWRAFLRGMYKIKLKFFTLKVSFFLFLKNKSKFLYGLVLYSRPGYIFLIIYLYILIICPILLELGLLMSSRYYDLSMDNWSWYGSYFPLSEFFVDYFSNHETLSLYNNKQVWFFKFGDPADVFLVSTIVSICYFLVFIPYFRYIWFSEPDWEVSEMDFEEDDVEWDEEFDDEVEGDPADSMEAYQDGEELDNYYDPLREKSLVRGRVGNYTVSNGHVLATESGWGFFISYWIFALFYSIKTFFWPETGWSPSFQIYDFEETYSNMLPFLEHYPLRNLQIYSAWMPGSPVSSPWVSQDWKKWRLYSLRKLKNPDFIIPREYMFDKWNNRIYKGFGELEELRKVRFSTGSGRMSTVIGNFFYVADYMTNRENFVYTVFDGEESYDKTDVYYEMYGNYPVGLRSTMWNRSIWYTRGFLNPMYNLGFNYLDFWPRLKTITPDYFSVSLDPYFKNKNDINVTRSGFFGNGDKRNFMLNKTYKYFVFDGKENWDYPLTYSDDIRRKGKSKRFRKRFFRGHINFLDTSLLTNEGDRLLRSQKDIQHQPIYGREGKVPHYGIVYDVGLTPYHLDVSNKWWKWMDKPLTTDPISIKYFLSYMSILNKNFDNSYNRHILNKLWQNYWSGSFRVGDIFVNSNTIKKYAITDLGHFYASLAEMKRINREYLMENIGIKSEDAYEELWLNIENMAEDIVHRVTAYDMEMFDLDFASNYNYPESHFNFLKSTEEGYDSLIFSSGAFTPLVEVGSFDDTQELFAEENSPLRLVTHFFEGSLLHEEAGLYKFRGARTSANISHSFFRKDILGTYLKHPNRYAHRVDQLLLVEPVRKTILSSLDRFETFFYDLSSTALDYNIDFLEDMHFENQKFKKILKYITYPFQTTQVENLKLEASDLFEEIIDDSIFENNVASESSESDNLIGLRMFPYSSEGFNSSLMDPSLWESLYREVNKELKTEATVEDFMILAEDRTENVKPNILKIYKKKLKKVLRLGSRYFDQYKNYNIQPFLYDVKFRDLIFKELNYPTITDNFRYNGLRLRWKFEEIFSANTPVFSILEDSLEFNLSKNNLEEEYLLYDIPVNLYMDENYIFVKEKIVKLVSQSLGGNVVPIERENILNKLKLYAKLPMLSNFLEMPISIFRKILRFFFINTDVIRDYLFFMFLDWELKKIPENEKFFYVFDNFNQNFSGYDENVILYKIDFFDYTSNLASIDGGTKIKTYETYEPKKYDYISGALVFPSKKNVLFLDKFFSCKRNVFVDLTFYEFGKLGVSNFKLRAEHGANANLVYDLSFFVPRYKFGFDIEQNIFKVLNSDRMLLNNSIFEINLDNVFVFSKRLEGLLEEDIDKLSRNLRSTKYFKGELMKNRKMFAALEGQENFLKYFSKKEDKNLYWSNILSSKNMYIDDEFCPAIDLHYEFWKGDITVQYLLTYDYEVFNFSIYDKKK